MDAQLSDHLYGQPSRPVPPKDTKATVTTTTVVKPETVQITKEKRQN
jgi:hypothetical protein